MCSCYGPDGVPVSLCNRKKICLLQIFEPFKAVEAQSIQTNLKVKQVWYLISYAETKKDISMPQIYQPKIKSNLKWQVSKNMYQIYLKKHQLKMDIWYLKFEGYKIKHLDMK